MACDATAIFKTPAQIQAGAMGALKGFDAKSLQGKDPKALLAGLPPSMQAMAKGQDLSKLDPKMLSNPAALAGKVPASMLAMLG